MEVRLRSLTFQQAEGVEVCVAEWIETRRVPVETLCSWVGKAQENTVGGYVEDFGF